jgi:hypothetical protein
MKPSTICLVLIVCSIVFVSNAFPAHHHGEDHTADFEHHHGEDHTTDFEHDHGEDHTTDFEHDHGEDHTTDFGNSVDGSDIEDLLSELLSPEQFNSLETRIKSLLGLSEDEYLDYGELNSLIHRFNLEFYEVLQEELDEDQIAAFLDGYFELLNDGEYNKREADGNEEDGEEEEEEEEEHSYWSHDHTNAVGDDEDDDEDFHTNYHHSSEHGDSHRPHNHTKEPKSSKRHHHHTTISTN